MNTSSERDSASELANRIESWLVDPVLVDEQDRPPEDRPPQFINKIHSLAPASIEKAADLTHGDWELIARALQHYANCQKG
jgi:hypothetical protein